MKKVLCSALGIFLLASLATEAFAQPGPPPGPPPGAPPPAYGQPGPGAPPPGGANPFTGPRYPSRRGLTIGFSLGFGSMDTGNIGGLGDDSVAFGYSGHVGWMITPQLGLLLEGFGAVQNTGTSGGFGDVLLNQTGGFLAAQFWPTPRLWLKGGIGGAIAQLQDEAGVIAEIGDNEGSVAFMMATGFEFLHSPRLSLDAQARFASATYDGISDQRISQFILAVGVSWYVTPVIGVMAY